MNLALVAIPLYLQTHRKVDDEREQGAAAAQRREESQKRKSRGQFCGSDVTWYFPCVKCFAHGKKRKHGKRLCCRHFSCNTNRKIRKNLLTFALRGIVMMKACGEDTHSGSSSKAVSMATMRNRVMPRCSQGWNSWENQVEVHEMSILWGQSKYLRCVYVESECLHSVYFLCSVYGASTKGNEQLPLHDYQISEC